MLRGYQRKLIMIRTKDSSIFESAFFILRGKEEEKNTQKDLVAEANKILEDSDRRKKSKKRWGIGHIFLSSVIGFFVGAGSIALAWLISVI